MLSAPGSKAYRLKCISSVVEQAPVCAGFGLDCIKWPFLMPLFSLYFRPRFLARLRKSC